MLEELFEKLAAVPPVPSEKMQREPLQAAPLLVVPPVPSVPPEKTKVEVKNSSVLNTDDERRILEWLSSIGADGEEINDTITRCRNDLGSHEYFLSKAAGLKRGNVIPFPVKKGFTRCYTPAGNPIDIEAASPEHADFLRKMNPEQELNHE